MKFNYKILHNYGNFLAVLKEIIFNVCEVREMSNDQTRAPIYEALESLEERELFRLMFRVTREEEAIQSLLIC